MKFISTAPANAAGWQLAHSVKIAGNRLPKGHTLTQEDVEALLKAGVQTLQAFCLEANDIDENAAAERIAALMAGPGVSAKRAEKGRINLVAAIGGILSADDSIGAINRIDEGITVATRIPGARVGPGEIVATIKIIPYALPQAVLHSLPKAESLLRVQPFRSFKAALITSDGLKATTAIETRLHSVCGDIAEIHDIVHTTLALQNALESAGKNRDIDYIFMIGKGAIADRRDLIPSALEKAGGDVVHLGMPVDPGNLLMLGRLGAKTVIGVPSCAKSPARNGFDLVLERLAARLPLSSDELCEMGIGGLLKPAPVARRWGARAGDAAVTAPSPDKGPQPKTTAAIILAAGLSSRVSTNKLLAEINGKSVIQRSFEALASSKTGTKASIALVTGRDEEKIRAIFNDTDLTIIHNPDFQSGLASSLKVGIRSVGNDTDLLLVCLGDMPFIRTRTIDSLFDAAKHNLNYDIFVPCFNGKRGNPVLWRRTLFPDLQALEGDTGGRSIMEAYADKIYRVETDDPGVLIDLDTREALDQFGAIYNDV